MRPYISITRYQPTLVATMTKHPMVELVICLAPILAFFTFYLLVAGR